MRWSETLRIRILMLFGRRLAATRLDDDELSFHLERQIAENVATGMTPEEARYSALRTPSVIPLLFVSSLAPTGVGTGLSHCCAISRYAFRAVTGGAGGAFGAFKCGAFGEAGPATVGGGPGTSSPRLI